MSREKKRQCSKKENEEMEDYEINGVAFHTEMITEMITERLIKMFHYPKNNQSNVVG